LNKRNFDVALLDMMMPGLSGVDVLDRIAAEPHDVEVILLTGQGTIDSAVKAMKLGACDYLTKPFPLSELEVLIEKPGSDRDSKRKTASSRPYSSGANHSPKSSASRRRCAPCFA
jgi:DNA-binding NtrC family response regulator